MRRLWRHSVVRRSFVSADVSLRDRFERGLAAPICLTWELTYACNLACTHCLSSSGRRDPLELSTAEAKALIDEIATMKIFYINIGGGEPMIRRDFFELIEYAVSRNIGVKFSTNGTRIDPAAAKRLASIDYLDIQISIDGVDAMTSDRIRGAGSYDAARRAMDNLRAADFGQFKIRS
jgi:mycofactocin radical SAM maturase